MNVKVIVGIGRQVGYEAVITVEHALPRIELKAIYANILPEALQIIQMPAHGIVVCHIQ